MTVLPKTWRRNQPPGLLMFVHRSRRLPLRVLAGVSGISEQRLRRLRDGRGTIRPDERARLAAAFRVDEGTLDQALRDCLVWRLQRDAQCEWNGVPADWNRARALARDDSLLPPSPGWLLFTLRQRDVLRYSRRYDRLKGPVLEVLRTIADGSYPAVFGGSEPVSDRQREEARELLDTIDIRRNMGREGRRFPLDEEIPPSEQWFRFFHLPRSRKLFGRSVSAAPSDGGDPGVGHPL